MAVLSREEQRAERRANLLMVVVLAIGVIVSAILLTQWGGPMEPAKSAVDSW